MLATEYDPPSDGDGYADRSLWVAVLWQAVEDARTGPLPASSRQAGTIDLTNEGWLAAIEARLFLTATAGAWRRAREAVCSVVDLDPEELRRHMVARFDPTLPPRRKGRPGRKRFR